MSESRPKKSPRKSSFRERSSLRSMRRKRDKLWFGVSVALHALAVAGLIYLTPVRQIVREMVQPTKPQATMSGSQLEKLAEAIEVRAADQILANAQELERILKELAETHGEVQQDFETFDRQRRRTAAAEAAEQMQEAVEQMNQAAAAIEKGASTEQVDRHQALAEQAQDRVEKKLGMVPFDVSRIAAGQKTASAAHQQAKQAHDEHRRQKEDIASQRQAQEERQKRLQAREEAVQKARDADRGEKRVKRLQQRADRDREAVEKGQKQLEEAEARARELRKKSAKKQREAAAAQKEVADSLRGKLQEMDAASAFAQAAAEPEQAAADGTPAPAPFLSGVDAEVEAPEEGESIDVADLYQQSQALEDTVAEGLKEVRAMDLAMVRDMKLEEAREDIDLVRPVRPELDTELLRASVRTGQRFEKHKEEVGRALRETTSMVNLARRMLEMARQSVDRMKFGSDVAAPSALAMERQELELIIRELAMEDVSGRYSNMAGMMQTMQQEGEDGETGKEGAEMGAIPRQDIEDLTREVEAGEEDFRLGGGEGEGDLPQLSRDVVAVGARKIAPGGHPGKWMYLDTWYTIGPFPNPNRVNIDRKFPPDSIIDLDATYRGKGGRTIRWRFTQSEDPQMLPPNAEEYGIWYAYTELYSDRPRDVWIACGTDDRGILKINGVTVWISSKRLKGWDIDEVWRRVHLKEGINRLLYRVENGWLHIGFSLTIKLEE